MPKDKNLLYYTNLFSPNEYQKNDKIILKHFQYLKSLRWKNLLRYLWKYRKFENPKISYICEKTFVFSIVCSKFENEDEKTFKEESIEILKIHNYFKNMVEENRSQEYRLKNVDETKNYFVEEIEQNELMSKKHKNVCTTLNYIEHSLILASVVTVSISALVSLFGILI